MEDSTTFGFAEDMERGKKFICDCVERTLDSLLLTDFAEFVANPEGDGQAVIRNGSYVRTFKTSFGKINVQTPRDRGNLYADRLPPYKHSLSGLCNDILGLYRRDMTYSEIRKFLKAESGCSFSETTIQKVVNAAYGEYRDFMSEQLEDCPFVFLDGTWITLKRQYQDGVPTVENECVLVALGITLRAARRCWASGWCLPRAQASGKGL